MPTREELWRFGPVDDPEIQAQRDHILEVLLDLATLERWLDRAVTAVSVSDALA